MPDKLYYIKEDFVGNDFKIQESTKTIEELTSLESKGTIKESSEPSTLIRAKIEAIHAGCTKNFTYYQIDKLKGDKDKNSGSYSWNMPYNKPVLLNHNTYNGEPIGRAKSGNFANTTDAERPASIVVVDILEKDASEKVRDGRYLTTSVGVHTNSVTCSICGHDIMKDGWCSEHDKGKSYDGETAMWTIGDIWFDEISFVSVPSDVDSKVVDILYDSLNLGSEEAKEMKDTEDIQNQEEEVKDDNTTKESDKTTEVVENEDIVESLNGKLESLFDQYFGSLLKEDTDTDEEDLGEKVKVLEEKVSELETDLSSSTEENKTLLMENANLETQLHSILAERVVDLRIVTGRVNVEDRDSAISKYVERSAEFLNDTLEDLMEEVKTSKALTSIQGTVQNPAGGAIENKVENSKIVDKKKDKATKTKKIDKSVEENLKALLQRRK